MKRFILILLGIAILLPIGMFVGWRSLHPAPPAAQVFHGGPILTMDKNNRIAEAILIQGDRITAVGSESEILTVAPADAIIHDLKGKALMPGFVDAHGHYPGWGVMSVAVDLNAPPIGNVTSIEDIKDRIRAKAATVPAGSLITAMGYDDTQIIDNRHPTAADLDQAAPDHIVIATHISGHMLVANSMALAEAGITGDSPHPPGGEIVKGADGAPTGLLKETAAFPLQSRALQFSLPDQLKIIEAGNDNYLSKGVTTAQNGLTEAALFTPLGWMSRLGMIPLRVTLLVDAKTAYQKFDQGQLFEFSNDKLHIAGVKLVTDGSIQGYTGFLGDPYFDHGPDHGAGYRGYPIYQQDELNDLVLQAYQRGLRPFLHGNGDAAIDMILNAVEHAQQEVPDAADLWPVIIHAQMIRPDQIARAKALKVSPSFFNAHVYYWGDRHRDIFMGPDRANRISPMAEALAADLPFSIHLDTPVVPMTPWLMIWSAVSRQTANGDVLGANQAVSVLQAIRATTIDAAWQAGLGDQTGSLEPGKWADMIIIEKDPRSTDDLRSLKVIETFVGGRAVWHHPSHVSH